jgi:hypothetical protein
MSQRGRKPGFLMSEEHRTKISNSKILNRLIACAEGELDITPVSAQVALALMNKVMPNLQATDLTAAVDTNITGARWLTEAETLQSSHIAQESNSSPSTTEPSDGLASWPTDGQAKQ